MTLPKDAWQDAAFLHLAWFWLTAGDEAPTEWKAPDFKRNLPRYAKTTIASLLPWLWRAWVIEGDHALRASTFRNPRMLISDWWATVRADLPIQNLPPHLEDVYGLARDQHGMFESEKTGRPLADWAKKLIPEACKPIMAWPSGFSLRLFRRPFGDRTSPQVKLLMEVGHVLAHCYLAHGVILHYTEQHEFLVLFDKELNPRCAFAVRPRQDDKKQWTWQITEQRGIFNIFPDVQYWPYLADLIGIKPKAFRQMPPGFTRIPNNQGTGEPPRARDPRADGADPIALEVWAAGHLRRPMIPLIQEQLDKVLVGVREAAKRSGGVCDEPEPENWPGDLSDADFVLDVLESMDLDIDRGGDLGFPRGVIAVGMTGYLHVQIEVWAMDCIGDFKGTRRQQKAELTKRWLEMGAQWEGQGYTLVPTPLDEEDMYVLVGFKPISKVPEDWPDEWIFD